MLRPIYMLSDVNLTSQSPVWGHILEFWPSHCIVSMFHLTWSQLVVTMLFRVFINGTLRLNLRARDVFYNSGTAGYRFRVLHGRLHFACADMPTFYLDGVMLAMFRGRLLPSPRVDRYRGRLVRIRPGGSESPGPLRPFAGSC
jgi:hypothetical protein